jgi:hypothetical protein
MSDASKLIEIICKNKWFKENEFVIHTIEDSNSKMQHNASKK